MGSSSQRFNAIVDDFDAALSTLLDVLQHIEDTKPRAELRVVMLNNTIVALTSTIEETLRGLFGEHLSILEESIEDHRKLPTNLQQSNLECAIREMKRHNSALDFNAAASLVSNLEKCLTGQSGYRLLKDQITYNKANFKSIQVTDMSKSVGLRELWRRISDCPEVEEDTGESRLDARVTRLTARWNEFFDERDVVVHRISQASGWGADKIQQSIHLSKLVLRRLATCLAEDGDLLIGATNSGNGTQRQDASSERPSRAA